MKRAISFLSPWQISVLLRGDPVLLRSWLEEWNVRRLVLCGSIIFAGAGIYGGAMGFWRAPIQGVFVAAKFPLIMLLTTFGNAVINAMLAPLLGLNLTWRQSFQSVLMSFTIASTILGSFSPLIAFLVWNIPPLDANRPPPGELYASIQLAHVGIIAFAGVVANLRLAQLLREMSGGNVRVSRRVLVAWLGGNLFLGSQLCWIFRPFIGWPGLPVQFLRPDAFNGNFFESVFRSIKHLIS